MLLILISGPVSSGKSRLSDGLESHFGAISFKTRSWLMKRLSHIEDPNRTILQVEGEKLDRQTRGKWVLDELLQELNGWHQNQLIVVDSVRTLDQIQYIREAFGTVVTHIHITAPPDELRRRYLQRYRGQDDGIPTYEQVRANPTETSVDSLQDAADVVIDSDCCTIDDVLVRATSRLRLQSRNSPGYLDVIVGGQYGSEGKGQIVAFIAPEYDLLVRVGGPNAGHTVFELPKPYTYHHLPSGTVRSSAQLLIGPGAVLNVYGSEEFNIKGLLREISEREVDADRLKIDGKAMIVSNQQKWDTLGAERSGAGWRSGELPEGPVVASSPFGGLSLHLLPAL